MTENTLPSKPNQAKEPDFLTVRETAWRLRLCEKQVRRLISRGELPAYRFGTALRIKRQTSRSTPKRRRIHAGLSKQDRGASDSAVILCH